MKKKEWENELRRLIVEEAEIDEIIAFIHFLLKSQKQELKKGEK